MSETVIVALAGLAASGLGAVLTYRAGLGAAREETVRMREQHREDERLHRREAYEGLIALINEMVWEDAERIRELRERWFLAGAAVSLSGCSEVIAEMRQLNTLLANGAHSPTDAWREQVIVAGRRLAVAMRDDIGAPMG